MTSQVKVDSIRHTGASADAITLASDGTCTAKITNNLSNRNLIINGSMNVSQRQTTTTTSGEFVLDRFKAGWSGADENITHAKRALTSSDTGPWAAGFKNCLSLTNGNQTSGAGAGDDVWIEYPAEDQDIACSGWQAESASSKLTISFWLKASVAQTYYVILETKHGTSKNYAFATTISSANVWQKFTKTIPGHADISFGNDNGEGVDIYFIPFYGTNKTTSGHTVDAWSNTSGSDQAPDMTSTWWTTNDATYELTGVQLEVGDTATDFEFLPYGVEEERCKRYFHRLVGGATDYWLQAAKYTNDTSIGIIHWSPWMRDIPTLSFNTGTNYHTFYSDSDESGANVSGSGWSIQQASKKSAGLRYLLTGSESGMSFAGSGDGIFWFSSSSATVDLNAEL